MQQAASACNRVRRAGGNGYAVYDEAMGRIADQALRLAADLQHAVQNEELRRVQVELHTVRTRYVDLYDMAPVSYCTLNKQGLIVQANFATAAMLGVARGALVKQPLSRFILKEDQDTYYLHRKQLLDSGEPQLCELRMVKDDGTSFWVHLATTVTHDHESNSVQRIVMMPCPRARPSEDQA